ncbi:MAG TPA: DUF1570 domain-containing protein, partial [Anaeromyxobacteraceae bacterium]|nr:DUF1570 domain-containing protein [Anaeromyxobacteraceae bacterium]
AHFVIQTNLDVKEARATAARFERLRAALLRGISRMPVDPPGRVEVVVSRRDAFEALIDAGRVQVAGWFEADPFGSRLVVEGSDRASHVAAHELAHYLLAYNFARLPLWLNEGLAQYFSTIELDVKKDGAVVASVGRPPDALKLLPRRHMLAARQARVPVIARAKTFFAWGTEPITYDLERADLYATGWATTHFLTNREPARFSQLLARLARAEPPATAWKTVFPEFDPGTEPGLEAFEKALEDYVEGTSYTYMRFEVRPDTTIASERELGDSEVHVLLATLLERAPRDRSDDVSRRVAAEVSESLRVHPDNAGALWIAKAKDRARPAIAATPEDWRGWMLLAAALEGDDAAWDERRAAYEKASQLAPDNAGVLNGHAWALLERGESVPALPVAVRAARAAPWSAAVLDTLGAVLADLGRACEAVPVQQRAVELSTEGAAGSAEEIRKRLADFEGQCRSTKM